MKSSRKIERLNEVRLNREPFDARMDL